MSERKNKTLRAVRPFIDEPAYWPLYTGLIGFLALQGLGWTLTEAYLYAMLIGLCTGLLSMLVVTARKSQLRSVYDE